MRDKSDKIIYVGKAINLKRRVTSYFRKTNKTQRILNMVSLIDHFEYIVVENEAEALILECNLIKKNMPKFNVLLKDDKTYPYIKINIKDEYPDVYITRKILNDGSKYYGPYADAGFAKETVDFLKDKFKIRHCKAFRYKDRACLNYHIKKCSGPCMGYISKEEYGKNIESICKILDGRIDSLLKEIKEEIEEASSKLEFERAQELRDKMYAIERINQRQKVSNISENDIDVIGLARNEDEIVIEVFYIRCSKMVDRKRYIFKDKEDIEDKEILEETIKRLYIGQEFLPNKIMIGEEIEDKELIEKVLEESAGRKVEIKVPQKGEKLKLVEMANNNAKITLENKEKDKFKLLKELQEVLDLKSLPRKIESFDISNLSGTNVVAGMSVMAEGIIKKSLARRFKIKTVVGQNDVECMKETVVRRLRHSIDVLKDENEKKSSFGKLPDLILADGGITQIEAIKEAIDIINKEIDDKTNKKAKHINIPVYGMVKNDKHQTRALIDDNRNEYEISEELLNLITLFQDSVHDTAISYHKKIRDKEITKSKLDEIDGIGEIKKKELLKKFKTIEKIKEATIEELTEVNGINEGLAKKIKEEI